MPLILIIFLIFPRFIFAQVDNIQLPDLELTIEDQSFLNSSGTEEALLKDRNPDFQEVYLEELSANAISDASFAAVKSQQNQNKYSFMEFLYGSFNDTRIHALSQNFISNLSYCIMYKGQIRDNAAFNKIIYPNTGLYNNTLNAQFSYVLNKAIIYTSLQYQQKKISFVDNPEFNQYTHYIPIRLYTKYWVNDSSYIQIKTDVQISLLQLKNMQQINTRNGSLIDTDLEFSYIANLAEWNYLTFDLRYALNDYNQNQYVNTTWITLASDFDLGKGFAFKAGAVFVASTIDKLYGWPELKLSYNYLNLFMMNLKVTGDFNLYNAELASQENQFYQTSPTKESKWNYSASIKIQPNPAVWFGGIVELNDYRNKRIYCYNNADELYEFIDIGRTRLLGVGASLGAQVSNIFEVAFSYAFENIPNSWLLYPSHRMDILLGLGYKTVGFWFETRFTLYSPRRLLENYEASVIPLWNFKFSQRIHTIAGLSLEFDNVLNKNIQFLAGTFYGGFQARGGVQLYF